MSAGSTVEFVVRPVDPEGAVPGLYARSLPANARLDDNRDGTRTFRWTPGTEDVGVHVVELVATDARDRWLQTSALVTITVIATGATNQAPQLGAISDQLVVAGDSIIFVVKPEDADGDVPGLFLEGLPEGAEFRDNFNGSRTFYWQTDTSDIGNYSLGIEAIDARESSLRTREEFLITVVADTASPPPADTVHEAVPTAASPVPEVLAASVNRAPYFEDLGDQWVALGDTLEFRVAPRDPDGGVPGLFADRLPPQAALIDNFDGTKTLRWRPFPVNKGDYWIRFTAIDPRDDAIRAHQSVRITIADLGTHNFPPVINGIDNPLIRAGDTLSQIVQPIDPDGEVPVLYVIDPPAGSDFVDNGDGTRSLRWPTGYEHITNTSGEDVPHEVTFETVDLRDPSLRDTHTVKISVVDPASLQRTGERLRVLADNRDIAIGFAAMLKSPTLADSQLYLDMARQEFNMVTPENSHKWGWIHPEPGVYRFDDADWLADFAIENGMTLHGHPLIWHNQLPGWVQSLEPSEVEPVMLEHIRSLVQRYRGRVAIWDVVNEAINDDGTMRDSVWHEALGDGFIATAFHAARQHDPDAVLLYNDYDVGWLNNKSDAMYELVRRELANGTPIDGVGFQMHVWTAFDGYEGVRRNFQRFADLGLDIYITELDVAMSGNGQEAQQGEVYARIARLCLQQPRCKAIQTWGFTDRYSWRYRYKPLLFDRRYGAKPAYYRLQQELGG